MLGLPPRPELIDEQRRLSHDQHRVSVVLAVLGVLALYAYLFTHAGALLGLPLPAQLCQKAGLEWADIFDKGQNVQSSLWMNRAHEFGNNDEEMLAYYLLLTAAFLWSYFLPVRYKRDALSFWTLVMVAVLYGWRSLAYFLAAHLTTYLVFHPDKRDRPWLAAMPGLLLGLALGEGLALPALLVVLPAVGFFLYVWIRPGLERPRLGPLVRAGAAHSILITFVVGSSLCGLLGTEGFPSLGLLLFLAHWMRLILYQVDYENGWVPRNLPLQGYLAHFLCPGMLTNWFTAIESQGYAYTESAFLAEDKNRIALSGVKLMLVGLVFMALGDWFTSRLVDLAGSLGIDAFSADIRAMSKHYAQGGSLITASVLLTSFLHLLKWTFFWAGVAHFKIGVWRICGFRMAAHFNLWLASTDLLTLWRRYTFHYRQFLVSAFYYPVFFRLAHWPVKLRIAAAIFAAAGVGNLVWGHACERVLYAGLSFENLTHFNRRWPYFVLLSAGITATYFYQMGRRAKRETWTRRTFAWDIACAVVTIQFYALLHVFAWSADQATLWDRWKMFLIGFGLYL